MKILVFNDQAGFFLLIHFKTFPITLNNTGAQFDVRSTTGHICRNGYSTHLPGFRHNFGFLFMMLGIQYRMRNPTALQHSAQRFGCFHGNGSHQHRASQFVQSLYFVNHSIVFFPLGAVNVIFVINAAHRFIGGNNHHIQFVNIPEFLGFGFSRTRHASQFIVQAEIILQGDGGQRLGFPFNFYIFLGFKRLMQSVAVPPAIHNAPGKFINDKHLPVGYHIIHILFKQRIRFKQLIDVMDFLVFPGVFQLQLVLQLHLFLRTQGVIAFDAAKFFR